MKPLSPNDSLDDLIAAALHGDLTPEERTLFDNRLQTDPAARAAYQEAQAMHDLLEKTNQNAQPDPAFEQRMVSGVRRKIQNDDHRETIWQSVVALWKTMTDFLHCGRRYGVSYVVLCAFVGLVTMSILISTGNQVKSVFTTISGQLQYASRGGPDSFASTYEPSASAQAKAASADDTPANKVISEPDGLVPAGTSVAINNSDAGRTTGSMAMENARAGAPTVVMAAAAPRQTPLPLAQIDELKDTLSPRNYRHKSVSSNLDADGQMRQNAPESIDTPIKTLEATTADENTQLAPHSSANSVTPAEDISRKLVRNADLSLEVKNFQATTDQITALTKTAGGYVDTSNSQKGGNGKLQGTVVVKVLPQNLDDFLLKLRDLGKVEDQAVKTDDVTKDYYDTSARLENSRRMEAQLQDLLKHENSKVSDLLQVERELARVRGEIEQMQGTLKVYDFDVAYATVTMQVRETDLNQAAAYLLKEQDEFSLFATDVEGTFQKARQIADDFKTQILVANLEHNSGTDVSAELTVMVAPEQIEPFLAQIRSIGRVANFTRQTQRVAKDGGDSDEPADETLTEKDKVQVHLSVRSDDESRKQVALTVVAKAVDTALDQAKAAALANAGTEILSSSLNKTPQGQSTAQLSMRVPGKSYTALLDSLRALGRTASFSLQRDDDSGPGANGDDAPVIITLALTDDDTPLQETQMSVLATDVDGQAQQIKKSAAAAGVEVKASSFERQPDGTEMAQMTFRLSMSKYPAFLESMKQLGKVESLTVHRDDRPDQTLTDDSAPAEISLQIHNQHDLVPDDTGLWATLRETFGEGMGALLGSVRAIGVVVAFLTPWLVTFAVLAWLGRRIYIWRKR